MFLIMLCFSSIPLSDCDSTEDTVTTALDRIKVNKTPSPDCIAPKVLRERTYQISKPLAIPFNYLTICK